MIVSMKPFVSVVIPSYNEMNNIKKNVLDEVYEYMRTQSFDFEIILSDDGSTDGTVEALKKFTSGKKEIRILENAHAGKAPTVKSGMLEAVGQWRLYTDFDQSTPISELASLLETAKKGHDIVIGSREMAGAKREKEPWYRRLMGRGFNILVQIIAVPGILDTQCGFKLFSDKATELLFNQLIVYGTQKERADAYTGAFDVELLFLAHKQGYSIREVPIQWNHAETNRVSPIKDSIRMLWDIIKIKAQYVIGNYALEQPLKA